MLIFLIMTHIPLLIFPFSGCVFTAVIRMSLLLVSFPFISHVSQISIHSVEWVSSQTQWVSKECPIETGILRQCFIEQVSGASDRVSEPTIIASDCVAHLKCSCPHVETHPYSLPTSSFLSLTYTIFTHLLPKIPYS